MPYTVPITVAFFKRTHEIYRVTGAKDVGHWHTLILKVLCTTLVIVKRIFKSADLLFGIWEEIIIQQAGAGGLR